MVTFEIVHHYMLETPKALSTLTVIILKILQWTISRKPFCKKWAPQRLHVMPPLYY